MASLNNRIPNFSPVLYYLFVVCFVLFLAYISSKFIAKNYNGSYSKGKTKHIKIIEKVYVGPDKSLILVSVGEKKYILSADKNNLNLLDKVEDGSLEQIICESGVIKNESFIDKLKGKWKDNS